MNERFICQPSFFPHLSQKHASEHLHFSVRVQRISTLPTQLHTTCWTRRLFVAIEDFSRGGHRTPSSSSDCLTTRHEDSLRSVWPRRDASLRIYSRSSRLRSHDRLFSRDTSAGFCGFFLLWSNSLPAEEPQADAACERRLDPTTPVPRPSLPCGLCQREISFLSSNLSIIPSCRYALPRPLDR